MKFNESKEVDSDIRRLLKKYDSSWEKQKDEYTIEDGKVSCYISCLNLENLYKIPIKFNKVERMFIDGYITSLENSPREIEFSLNLYGCTKLKSLSGAPDLIGRFFYIRGIIDDIRGMPKPKYKSYILSLIGGNENGGSLKDILSLFLQKNDDGFIIDDRAIELCELFTDFDPIRGVDIYLDRLNSFLETIGKPTIESIYGYNMI